MQILNTSNLSLDKILIIIRRCRSSSESLEMAVRKIIGQVKDKGDEALYTYSEKFDGAKLLALKVSTDEIKQAYKKTSKSLIQALQKAKSNIEKFQSTTLMRKEKTVKTSPGVSVWREFRPIEKVGLYIPGGKAAYPSTVLMLAVPAKIAGCSEIIMCTPPAKDGSCNQTVLAAAYLCGITKIFKVGGAQAIAAMAYGTQTIPKVSKIFGPGNQYVTTSKMLVYGEVDIDMPAGPSEIAVVADSSANPKWVAADMSSQLEHGADSQSLLVTFSEDFAKSVILEMQRQMSRLSRKATIEESFKKSFAVIASGTEEACEIINEYAPEHLEIICKNGSDILKKINNAGSVFLGPYASEPLGDYATGTNHTLPTSGFAKMFSALSPESFGKMMQIQKISKQGITGLRKTAETLASAEGLSAHKNAVTIRFI